MGIEYACQCCGHQLTSMKEQTSGYCASCYTGQCPTCLDYMEDDDVFDPDKWVDPPED